MEGAERTHLVIDRFSRFAPGETCERNMADASLTNTYWKILKIADAAVHVVEDRREPHMILRTGESPDFTATVGCNKIRGGYETQGAKLSFDKIARTMMACPPPLDAWESALAQALAEVAAWQVNANTLELFDTQGTVVLMAEAVYLH
jgi:heat shock protein HslJ